MVKKALTVSAAPTFADVSFHAPRPDLAPVDPEPVYETIAEG